MMRVDICDASIPTAAQLKTLQQYRRRLSDQVADMMSTAALRGDYHNTAMLDAQELLGALHAALALIEGLSAPEPAPAPTERRCACDQLRADELADGDMCRWCRDRAATPHRGRR